MRVLLSLVCCVSASNANIEENVLDFHAYHNYNETNNDKKNKEKLQSFWSTWPDERVLSLAVTVYDHVRELASLEMRNVRNFIDFSIPVNCVSLFLVAANHNYDLIKYPHVVRGQQVKF